MFDLGAPNVLLFVHKNYMEGFLKVELSQYNFKIKHLLPFPRYFIICFKCDSDVEL